MPTFKIHEIDTTEEAYDMCMTGHNWMKDCPVKTGDILVIKREKVVGICDTWPLAVSKESGELHAIAPGYTAEDVLSEHLEAVKEARVIASELNF